MIQLCQIDTDILAELLGREFKRSNPTMQGASGNL